MQSSSASSRASGRQHRHERVALFRRRGEELLGTLATTDRLIKEQPKQVGAFIRATVKALRFIRLDRDGTIAANVKFSGIDRNLATRMYDDLIGTFTRNGTVDEETQKNDLSIIRQIADESEPIPIARVYDFSLAYEADRQISVTVGGLWP
jgi:ABC-type nitrate/sulfonate/bicarbonate transport system substrate-binding protein